MSRRLIVGVVLFVGLPFLPGRDDVGAQDPKPKDVWEKYMYPKYEHAGPVSQSGNMHGLLITTTDDFEKVITWYAKVTDQSLEKAKPGSVSSSTAGVSVQDISSPSVSTRILVQHEKSCSFTLVVSRAKDEKLTRGFVVGQWLEWW